MQTSQTIDDVFNFLQNKTIKDIGADIFDNKYYLVILLSEQSNIISVAGKLFKLVILLSTQ